jgi:hypothetical protein
MSELIWEYAGDFLQMGETLQQKQNLLNAACSAWAIACGPLQHRKKGLDRYMESYQRSNPNADEAHLVGVRDNMEKLIEQKLKMFPNDLRIIVGARVLAADDGTRIEIASMPADSQGRLIG